MQQPVFFVPSAESFQRIESVKQQIQTMERSIKEFEEKDQEVPQGIKDSLLFLRAQNDSLVRWELSMQAQKFPPGMVYVAPGGQAFYHAPLPETSGMQAAAFARSIAAEPSSPQDVVVPSVPSIKPIKTLSYPSRRSTRDKKTKCTEITVKIRTASKKKTDSRAKRGPKSKAVADSQAFEEALMLSPDAIKCEVPQDDHMINGNVVIKEARDTVRINGHVYVPDAFRWWTDPNGNKFFVYIPNMLWDDSRKQFAIRILFSVPDLFTIYHGTSSDPCFETVRNLHQLAGPVLSRMWYVKVLAPSAFSIMLEQNSRCACTDWLFLQLDAKIPKATHSRLPHDTAHFPLHKSFVGYKPGDTVYVKRSTHQRGHVQAVYTKPDKTRVYLVFAASAEVPDLRVNTHPFMATLTQEDLRSPCIEWKTLRLSLRSVLFQSKSFPQAPPLICACGFPGGGPRPGST